MYGSTDFGINFGGGDIRISDDSNINKLSTCELGYSYETN